jgi:hypothetical protein
LSTPNILILCYDLGLPLLVPLFVIKGVTNTFRLNESARKRESVAPFFLLALILPLLFYSVSLIGLAQVFFPRYFLRKEIGVALLGAWATRSISPPVLQRLAVIAVVITTIVASALGSGGAHTRGRGSRLIG